MSVIDVDDYIYLIDRNKNLKITSTYEIHEWWRAPVVYKKWDTIFHIWNEIAMSHSTSADIRQIGGRIFVNLYVVNYKTIVSSDQN